MKEKESDYEDHHLGETETAPSSDPRSRDVNIRSIATGMPSVDKNDQLERGLKSRHIQFLALGGA